MGANNESSRNDRFVFREARTIEELDSLLRLRYRVYRNCDLQKCIPENRYGIDIDSYDLRSRHFGLFLSTGRKESPVGYLRVAEDKIRPGIVDAGNLRNRYPDLRAVFESDPGCPFPLMQYIPNAGLLLGQYKQAKSRHERFCEAGRFALDDDFRSFRLARHMVECAFAVYFFYYGFEHAIWCCDASNGAFYRKYGLAPVDGIPEGDYLGIGEQSVCLIGSPWSIPASVRERISRMAVSYAGTGSIPLDWEKTPRASAETVPAFTPAVS